MQEATILEDYFDFQSEDDIRIISQLKVWLDHHQVTQLHACMEATGVYYEELATYLYHQEYTVSVVNPWQIKAYGDSKLRRHKTDRLDANLIADFCHKEQPRAWRPLATEERTLQALVRHLDENSAATM